MVHKMQFPGEIRVGNRSSFLQEWQSVRRKPSAVSKRASLNENLFADRQYCLDLTEGRRNAMLR